MENKQTQKKSISDVVKEYNESKNNTIQNENNDTAKNISIPSQNTYKPENFKDIMNKESDPDLIISYEEIKLPSKGLFYKNKIGVLDVEYMVSKDEDILTTPSLIESGKILDILLKRKIKTKGIDPQDLLPGDRNAVILFLRISAYGPEYSVELSDPRTGIPFKTKIDLSKLEYKEINETPNDDGHFMVDIPMRKKTIIFKLLSSGEDKIIFDRSEAMKEASGEEFSQYNSMKLKAHIVSIDGNTDRNYINKFVDAMPPLDSLTIRRKIQDVSPDVDMKYPFVTKDGYKFYANLQIGIDFFFPGI